MSEKIKVLIVNDVLQYGGSDLVAVRLQQSLDPQKFECVYCVRHDEIGPFEKELAKTGVRIIHQPDNQLGYIKSYKYFKNLFKNEHFDVVHSHLLFYSAIVLTAAKKSGIKKRVAHSHFSQSLRIEKNLFKKAVINIYRFIMRKLLVKNATTIIGCSQKTGEYLAGKNGFAKKGIVLNNGIDTSIYKFDENIRIQKRQELGINNEIVIGHIGQMYYVKNHDYLIDVFNEFQKKNSNSVLLLISDGPDREKLENKVKNLNLANKVKFLGFRDDIPELLMAMDCFVFPSIHEGFPLTLIEAQSSKLPCIVSDSITNTVELSNAIEFMSINEEPKNWANKIDDLTSRNRIIIDNSKVIENFDIKNISKQLEKIYLN